MDTVDYRHLELSTQILIDEALRRNISVEVLDAQDNLIRLKKDGKTEYIMQASRTSADSYIVPLLMENKEITKRILREHGISVPHGIVVQSKEEADAQFPRFADTDIVIKPKSTNHGKGVTILRRADKPHCLSAVSDALHYDRHVLIEEFLHGEEYRFLTIGDQVPAVLHRIPANVMGDGIHTIEYLVNEKNKDPRRGVGYTTPLEKIQLGQTETNYLSQADRTIRTVPHQNEVVYLRENSNISTGGDSIDMTDEIPQEYKAIAVRAAKAIGAKICGADMIIRDMTQPPSEHNYGVIELNFNPALHMHDFPYRGKNRHVEAYILNLLGF